MKKMFVLFLLTACLVSCASVNIPPKPFYVQSVISYNNTKTFGIATDIYYSIDYNLEKQAKLDTVSFNIKSNLYSYEFIFSAKEFQKIVHSFVIAEEKSKGTASINLGSLEPYYIYITSLDGKTFRVFTVDKINFDFYDDGNSKQLIIGAFKATDFSARNIIYALDDIPVAATEVRKIDSFVHVENIKNLRRDKIKELRLAKKMRKKIKNRQ